METAQDIHIHIVPVYYKRRIEYRPEVATFQSGECEVWVQNDNAEWECYDYFDLRNMFHHSFPTQEEAIKAAQDFVETLKA